MDGGVEGKINIIDYKTGKPFSEKIKKSEKDDLKRQLVFYYILYENFAEGRFRINKAILDFIEKNRHGQFEQYTVDISTGEISEVKNEINNMVAEITSGKFLEKGCNKRDCEYCNYRKTVLGI